MHHSSTQSVDVKLFLLLQASEMTHPYWKLQTHGNSFSQQFQAGGTTDHQVN